MGYLLMDPNKKFTTEDLTGLIPIWCFEGNLVRVDEMMFHDERERVGLILDYYVIDVDQLNKEDYDDIIYYEEWLLIDISTDDGILQAVNSYSVSPVTLMIKVGEEDAKIQP